MFLHLGTLNSVAGMEPQHPPQPPPQQNPPQQPTVRVTGFSDAASAAAAGDTAVVDREIRPVPLAHRGCLVSSCGVGCATCLQLVFAFMNAFWMLWTSTGGTVFRGYSWIVASLYALAAVEAVATCVEFASARTQAAYALSAVGSAASALSVALMVFFLVAIRLDYTAKCEDFELLEDRVLSAAYPYDCGADTGGPLQATWTGLYIVAFMLVPKLVITIFTCARCCWHRFDHNAAKAAQAGGLQQSLLPGSNQPQPSAAMATACAASDTIPALLLGVLAAVAVSTATAGLFINAQRPAPSGSCPGSPQSNFTDDPVSRGLAELLFHPEPLLGSELPECAWRTEQGGSCVRYPINPAGLNRTTLGDPAAGRFVPSLSASSKNDSCATLLGLYSCSVYSPKAGDFVRGLSLRPANWCAGVDDAAAAERCTELVFETAVCSSFCANLLSACSGDAYGDGGSDDAENDTSAFCYGATSPEDCCARLGGGVSVVDSDEEDCYNAAPRAQPWYGAVAVGFVVATGAAAL